MISSVSKLELKMRTKGDSKYDGIICPLFNSQFDLGFIEVKPSRVPIPVKSDTDREKVLSTLKGALDNIRTLTNGYCMEKVLVIGIICNGGC